MRSSLELEEIIDLLSVLLVLIGHSSLFIELSVSDFTVARYWSV